MFYISLFQFGVSLFKFDLQVGERVATISPEVPQHPIEVTEVLARDSDSEVCHRSALRNVIVTQSFGGHTRLPLDVVHQFGNLLATGNAALVILLRLSQSLAHPVGLRFVANGDAVGQSSA